MLGAFVGIATGVGVTPGGSVDEDANMIEEGTE